jgi:hypothetical protein
VKLIGRSVSEGITRLLWYTNVYCRVYKSPLAQPYESNPDFPHCFFNMYFNIILPSVSESPEFFRSSSFPTSFLCSFVISHACYMSCLSHIHCFGHSYNIWWRVKIVTLRIMKLSPIPAAFCLLGPNIILRTLVWNAFNLCSSLSFHLMLLGCWD